MNIRKHIREAMTTNDSKYSEKWDALSREQRADLIKRSDPTMRNPRWSSLVERMSEKSFEELSSIQKDAVIYALKRPVRR